MSQERGCRRTARHREQEIQSGIKEGLQQQLRDVEHESHDLLPEHQRVQKRSQKYRVSRIRKRNLQKKNVAAREEMRMLKEDVKRKRGACLCSVGQRREKHKN